MNSATNSITISSFTTRESQAGILSLAAVRSFETRSSRAGGRPSSAGTTHTAPSTAMRSMPATGTTLTASMARCLKGTPSPGIPTCRCGRWCEKASSLHAPVVMPATTMSANASTPTLTCSSTRCVCSRGTRQISSSCTCRSHTAPISGAVWTGRTHGTVTVPIWTTWRSWIAPSETL